MTSVKTHFKKRFVSIFVLYLAHEAMFFLPPGSLYHENVNSHYYLPTNLEIVLSVTFNY